MNNLLETFEKKQIERLTGKNVFLLFVLEIHLKLQLELQRVTNLDYKHLKECVLREKIIQ